MILSKERPVYKSKKHRRTYLLMRRRIFIFICLLFLTFSVTTTVKVVTLIKKAIEEETYLPSKTHSSYPLHNTHLFYPPLTPVGEEEKETPVSSKIKKEKIYSLSSIREIENAISKEERNLLERLVEAEARGESLKGKVAVINVILNRVKHKDFPDTITDVILEKRQFSPVDDGNIYNMPSKESILAVEKAMDESQKVIEENVVYFCNVETSTSNWIIDNKEVATTIGNHTFFFE